MTSINQAAAILPLPRWRFDVVQAFTLSSENIAPQPMQAQIFVTPLFDRSPLPP